MLHESGLPKFLWAEAIVHAVYLKNRTWTHTLGDTTPYEILNGQKPNLKNLQPWGCKVQVHDTGGSKLDGCSKIGQWMGFDAETKDRHHIYWPEKRSVTVERSVKFNFEEEIKVPILPFENKEVEQSITPPVEIPEKDDEEKDVIEEIPLTKGRGKWIRKESEYIRMLREGVGITGEKSVKILPKGIQEGTSMREPEELAMATAIATSEGLQPTYEEAHKRPDWSKWDLAIQKELEGLKKTGTWKLVEWPTETNVVNNRWVLRMKKNAAGKIEKYKACLVAKGFTQIYGINYYETYAPVARLSSFHLLLAIAA